MLRKLTLTFMREREREIERDSIEYLCLLQNVLSNPENNLYSLQFLELENMYGILN